MMILGAGIEIECCMNWSDWKYDQPGDTLNPILLKFRYWLRFQPVDATHWAKRSAGVRYSNVFLGRSFSRRATAFSRF